MTKNQGVKTYQGLHIKDVSDKGYLIYTQRFTDI